MYGPRGLALLASGLDPQQTLKQLLAQDGNFDGEGIADRQVGIVALDGRVANYSGSDVLASPWAGALTGDGYSIQGNGLAGPMVVAQMQRAFLAATGPLAKRLLAALAAGDAAGGQSTGRQSAALLVRTTQGFHLISTCASTAQAIPSAICVSSMRCKMRGKFSLTHDSRHNAAITPALKVC